MPHFVCRLIPPRASFPFDMNEAEQAAMGRHAAYLAAQADEGRVVLFGPVADPKGPYGLLIVEAADLAEVESLTRNDPAILAGLGLAYEVSPMMSATFARPGPT